MDGERGREAGVDVGGHRLIEIAQSLQIDIEDLHPSTESSGHSSGIGTHHSTAKDHHAAWFDTGDPRQEHSPATILALQISGSRKH